MIKNKAVIFIICFALYLPCYAGNGENGFQFLELGMGARQVGMGETVIAVADDVNAAVNGNAAAWGEIRQNELALTSVQHTESMSSHSLSFAKPFANKGSLGLQMQSFDYGDISGYDAAGLRTSQVDAGDTLMAVGYGRPLGPSWNMGINIKSIKQKIGDTQGQTIGADIGLLYVPMQLGKLSRLRLGFSFKNLGKGAAVGKAKTALPQTMGLGIGYKMFSDSLFLAMDIQKTRNEKMHLHIGQETWLNRVIGIRLGYRNENDFTQGLNYGIGFKYKDLQLDYALVMNSHDFGETHRFGLIFRFGGVGEALYQEGLGLSQTGNYGEAIMKFYEALDINPHHQKAVNGLREAAEMLKKQRGKSQNENNNK